MFEAQIRLLRETYGIARGEVDLPLLPIFALFNPALGMTSVISGDRSPAAGGGRSRQDRAGDPAGRGHQLLRLADPLANHPRLLRRGSQLTLPSLRRVLCAGAPVPAVLWKKSGSFLSSGKLHSPYGATGGPASQLDQCR